jgi:class 3 adenylate cyclase/acyl dehydratase
MPHCAACGRENPEGFRFCGACGVELSAPADRREVRKTVTVVFCDVTGSTALGEQLDPEALRRTMGRYFGEIRLIIERHGGTVEKFIGDAVMAVFGIPIAHEDDALRAVRAVVEIRNRLEALGDELSVALSFRTGVNTGEVVAGEGETLVTGDAVNVAARLEQAAAPGSILIGANTLGLVRDAVSVEPVEPLQLKGKREPVPAFRLVSLDATAEAFARRLDSPIVGRVRERQRLQGDFESVVSERACHLFTLLGPAGVGKSRLVAEFLAGAGGTADVLRARCLHYGEDITYWPLVEILIAIGVDPETLIGSSPADTQLAFRRLLETRAAERPQIVVFDDIQWAEPVFLDLVEHVADWSRDAPIFLLCVARPELLEERPAWGGGKLNAATILLEPLPADDCETLLDTLAAHLELPSAARTRILAAADGNPLFLEEMVAMLDESDGHDQIVVPPTIQALLQARLDRLGAEERDVIGRGAVEGQVFHRGVVQELAPASGREDVPARLLTLVRKDVIRPERATFADDDAFRFRHLLIRDAAYDALPKETRAELHERFADWLDEHVALVEQDEIVGYHLEQAHRNLAELDGADPRLDGLAHRAATRLGAAADTAELRGDYGALCGLVHRAIALLPEGDPQRLELMIGLAVPFNIVGLQRDSRAFERELLASPDERFHAFGLIAQLLNDGYGEEWDSERSKANAAAAREVFTRLEDDFGLAWVERSEWAVHWLALRTADAAAAAARAEIHARAAGDTALAAEMRQTAQRTLAYGPAHVDEVLAAARAMLAEATGTVASGTAQRALGRVLAMRGEFEDARENVYAGNASLREAGQLVSAAAGSMLTAFVEVRAGAPDIAETVLREGIDELDRLEQISYRGTTALALADLLADRGAYEEALRWCTDVRAAIREEDLTDVIGVDAIEGFLVAQRGAHAQGESLTRRAVDLAAETDMYEHKGRAYEWHAKTLAIAGKPEEARQAAAAALAIYEAKGDLPAIAWARALLDSLRT